MIGLGYNPLSAVDPGGLDYYLIGGDQCGQNGVNCDNQGYVLDDNGNRTVITDQQIVSSIGVAQQDANGNLQITTAQGTFQGQFFDPNPQTDYVYGGLEDQVMRMLLAGDDQALAVLRDQIEQAKVSSRQLTGVGFYTEFSTSPSIPRLSGRPSFKLGDVNGTAANVKNGLGFLLYVADGAITMLEGYTYDDPWPNRIEGLVLTYSDGQNRNIDKVRQIIHPA